MEKNNAGCDQEYDHDPSEDDVLLTRVGNELELEVVENANVSNQDACESPSSNSKTNTTEVGCKNEKGVALANGIPDPRQDDHLPNASSFNNNQNSVTEKTDCSVSTYGENSIEVQDSQETSHMQSSFIESDDGNFNTPDEYGNTALHLAVLNNEPDTIESLLNRSGIQINAQNNDGDIPIFIAVKKGYHNVVRILLEYGNRDISLKSMANNKTILHYLFQGMQLKCAGNSTNDNECDYRKCLEYVLKKLPDCVEDPKKFVNEQDSEGMTALHFAIEAKEEEAVLRLLIAGSQINHKTKKGNVILQNISIEVLTKYLDNCVSMDESTQNISQRQLIFDCEIFKLGQNNPLLSKSFSELKDIRKLDSVVFHPIVEAYVSYQRYNYRQTFLSYLILYIFVYFFLICYIEKLHTEGNSECLFLKICTFPFPPPLSPSVPVILMFALGTLCDFLFLRIGVLRWRIFKSLEFIIKLLQLGTFIHLIWFYDKNSFINTPILAVILLTSDFVIQFGTFPVLSMYAEMFKVVLLNVTKILFSYSIMILAYGFCWYTMNRQTLSQNTCYSYKNATLSFVYAFATLTGPLLSGSAEIQTGSSQLIFFLSIFLIAIVLANILNGLAVNDIHIIKKNAKLFGALSYIKFAILYDQYLELYWKVFGCKKQSKRARDAESGDIQLGCSLKSKSKSKNCDKYKILYDLKVLFSMPRNFTYTFSDNKIYVLPSAGNTVMRRNKAGKLEEHSTWKIDPSVVEHALKNLEKSENSGIDFTETLTKQTRELETIKQTIKLLEKNTQHLQKNNHDLESGMDHNEYQIMKENNVEMERALELQKNYNAILEQQMKLALKFKGKLDARFSLNRTRIGTRYRLKRRHGKIFGGEARMKLKKQSDDNITL